MSKCILCGAKSVTNIQDSASRTIYNCPICGVFVVSDLVERDVIANSEKIASFMAHRKLAGQSDIVLISLEKVATDKGYVHMSVSRITEHFPQNIKESIDLALQNLSMLSEYPGDEVVIDSLSQGAWFYLEKVNYDAMSYVVSALEKKGFLSVRYIGTSFFPCGITLSPEGWERVALRESQREQQHEVLVCAGRGGADSFGEYKKAVTKACKSCGYNTTDSAVINEDGRISWTLLARIRQARFLICDMSDASQETYYAAGMARGLGKPVLVTCRTKDRRKLKVDVEEFGIAFWEDAAMLDDVIVNAIRAFDL